MGESATLRDSDIQRICQTIEDYKEIFAAVLDGVLGGSCIPYGIQAVDRGQDCVLAEERLHEYCRAIRRSGGLGACTDSNNVCIQQAVARSRASEGTCHAGLVDIAAPLTVGGQQIAAVLAGQLRLSDQDWEREAQERVKARATKLGLDPDELLELWSRVPVVSRDELEGMKGKLDAGARVVSRLIQDRIKLDRQASEAEARQREGMALQTAMLPLQRIDRLEKFWLRLNAVLRDIGATIGTRYGMLLVSEGSDTFVIRAYSDPSEKGEYVGTRWPVSPESTLGKALRSSQGSVIETVDFLDENEPIGVHFLERDLHLDTALVEPFQWDEDSRAAMFFLGNREEDAATGLTFEEELRLLDSVASRVAGSHKNWSLHEQQLERQRERLRFFQDVTHQVVQPLAGIQAHAENIHRRILSSEQSELAARSIIEQTRILDRLVRNARWEVEITARGRLRRWGQLNLQKIDLTGIVMGIVVDMQSGARWKGARIHVDTDTMGAMPRALVDRLYFEHAVMNLLDNAIKYSNRDTTINIKASRDDNWIHIHFTSCGIPLRAEEVDQVFDRFRRGEAATKKFPVGLGLGLYVTRQIMRAHGGCVSVEPSAKAPRGYMTTFVLSLPLPVEETLLEV